MTNAPVYDPTQPAPRPSRFDGWYAVPEAAVSAQEVPRFYLNVYAGGIVGIQQIQPYAIPFSAYGALASRLKEDLELPLGTPVMHHGRREMVFPLGPSPDRARYEWFLGRVLKRYAELGLRAQAYAVQWWDCPYPDSSNIR